MAAAVSERTWRDSTPESVERDLAAVWRDVACRGTVARAVMSNVVAFRLLERRKGAGAGARGAAAADDEVLEAAAARHPSRLIVIEHERGDHDARTPIGAGVAVCMFGPESARYAIEKIVVRSASAEISLPSIVRRFVRGELPTSLWWTEDLSRCPLMTPLAGLARQLIYDSAAWHDVGAGIAAIAPLAREDRIDLADLNWRRLAPLRRGLVHEATTPDAIDMGGPIQVAHRPGAAAMAWLLGGWLAARLHRGDLSRLTIVESPKDDDLLTLSIGAGDPALRAAMSEARVEVTRRGATPIVLPAARESAAEAIAAELGSLSRDRGLHETIRALASYNRS
jgi:glucose-6-phosphate dehydrogenase assembly protein OpcA